MEINHGKGEKNTDLVTKLMVQDSLVATLDMNHKSINIYIYIFIYIKYTYIYIIYIYIYQIYIYIYIKYTYIYIYISKSACHAAYQAIR